MAHQTPGRTWTRRALRDVQRLTAVVLGAALTLVGVAGLVGAGGGLPVLGAGPLASGAYLLTGVLGLGVGLVGGSYAGGYNQSMAVLYGALALLRFRYPDVVPGVADVGAADAWFHLALAAAFGAVGFFGAMAGYRLRG
ncbi:hypothetical protein [Halorarum salinum]|uniref:Uncharacterized protein n=1 Tax=Halorarum salinum TaxID=2743089 RepID=A0A7D5LDP0_9EURY|nr:hypothetical protein [Halobaculum salinum]QLG64210.1 hypothetical protein HUG12_20700 [Halobaculum salinum]